MSLSTAVLEAVAGSEGDAQAQSNDSLAWTSAPTTTANFSPLYDIIPFSQK